MKTYYIFLCVLCLSITSCDVNDLPVKRDVLTSHNMKIFPEKPTSSDVIRLIIYDDCKYNVLSKNERTGQSIYIEKQFNSMMKWPCVQQNDTILIGKLPSGLYNVNYTLIDISQQPPMDISLEFSFQLGVAK